MVFKEFQYFALNRKHAVRNILNSKYYAEPKKKINTTKRIYCTMCKHIVNIFTFRESLIITTVVILNDVLFIIRLVDRYYWTNNTV